LQAGDQVLRINGKSPVSVRITEDIDSPANWLTKRQIQELEFHLKSRIKDKIAAGGHKGPSEPGVQEQFKEMDLSSLSTELSYFDLNNCFVVEEFCRILSQHSEVFLRIY